MLCVIKGSNNGMSNDGVDGVGVRKDSLWQSGDSTNKDGYWAYHTYL